MDTETHTYLTAIAEHAHDQADLAETAADRWQHWADQLARIAEARPSLPTLRDPDEAATYGAHEASPVRLHIGHLATTGRTTERLHHSRTEADAIAAALRRAARQLRHTAHVAETTTTDQEAA